MMVGRVTASEWNSRDVTYYTCGKEMKASYLGYHLADVHDLGCAFLLPFLQSEPPPKGILQESFSFLSKIEDSFFIFLQFGSPPTGKGLL